MTSSTITTIINPALPLSTPIIGGLYEGRTIVISAFAEKHCDRFRINLQTGAHSDDVATSDDIAFHFNPRYDESLIVMNSKICGDYGESESESLPDGLTRKRRFQLRITCNNEDFHVYLNNEFIARYAYRVPVSEVNILAISGDVQIHSLAIV